MKKETHIPDWAWNFYQAKQAEACTCPTDATEETLNYLVHVFGSGSLPESQSSLEKAIDNHLAGERQKVRRRYRILENIAATSPTEDATSADKAAVLDSLAIIRKNITQPEWRLLTDLAEGTSYRCLSSTRSVSTGTIKSSVSRLRKRLRCLVSEDVTLSMAA